MLANPNEKFANNAVMQAKYERYLKTRRPLMVHEARNK